MVAYTSYPLKPPYRLMIMTVGMTVLAAIAIIWTLTERAAPLWVSFVAIMILLLLMLPCFYYYVQNFPQALLVHDQRISFWCKGKTISINHPPIVGDKFISVPRARFGPWLLWWLIPSECLEPAKQREIRCLFAHMH